MHGEVAQMSDLIRRFGCGIPAVDHLPIYICNRRKRATIETAGTGVAEVVLTGEEHRYGLARWVVSHNLMQQASPKTARQSAVPQDPSALPRLGLCQAGAHECVAGRQGQRSVAGPPPELPIVDTIDALARAAIAWAKG